MTHWPTAVLLLLLSVAAATAATITATAIHKKTTLTVGYLTAIKGELKDRQGLAISGALTMALEEINNSDEILPNVMLELRWNDTKGETVLATRAITEMICDGVATFFGPEGPCHVEAIVSQSRNIPMISYKCSDYMASSIPTFARTEPPDTQFMDSPERLNEFNLTAKNVFLYHLRHLLIRERYPVNQLDDYGNTALHFLLMPALVREPEQSAKSLYFGTKLLIDSGANLFLKNHMQLRPLDIVIQASPKYNKGNIDPDFAALTMLIIDKTLLPDELGVRFDSTDLLRVVVMGLPMMKKVIINRFYLKPAYNELHEFATEAIKKHQVPYEMAGFIFSFGPDLVQHKDELQELEKLVDFDFTRFFSLALDGNEAVLDFVLRLLDYLRGLPLTFIRFKVYTQLMNAYIHRSENRRRNYDPNLTERFLNILQRLRALDFPGANCLYATMVIPALKDILGSFIGAPKHCRVDTPEWVADKARHFRALLFYCGAKQAYDAEETLRDSLSTARVGHGENLFRHYIQEFEDFFPIDALQDITKQWRVTPEPRQLRELCREKLRKTIEQAMSPYNHDDEFIRRLKTLNVTEEIEKYLRYVDARPYQPISFEMSRNAVEYNETGSNKTVSVLSFDMECGSNSGDDFSSDDQEIEMNITKVHVWTEPDLNKVLYKI